MRENSYIRTRARAAGLYWGQVLPALTRRQLAAVQPSQVRELYHTSQGRMLVGRIEDALQQRAVQDLRGKVNLIFTSPPFPLVRKKEYGNKTGSEYLEWLKALAPALRALLAPKGSIVVEIGNAWVKGQPVMSTLPLEALLAFKNAAQLHLCQHVICHNPARLPSPASWVSVERIRLKDSYTHVWWMSPTERPKASNRRVLVPYSREMMKLLRSQEYNSGKRPSGHRISEKGFLKDHGGAISANVIDMEHPGAKLPSSVVKFAATGWDKNYRAYCTDNDLVPHPARMQVELAAFFIKFLTTAGDLVLDPFAGSNTTGAVAEELGRRWIAVEADAEYASGSKGRFKKFRAARCDD